MADIVFAVPIFKAIDQVTTVFANDTIGKFITYAAPIVGLGLVIAFMVQGLMTMMQPSGEPVSELLKRFIRYAAITAIAGVGGLYQTTFAGAALNLPDQISSLVVLHGTTSDPSSMGQVIDNTLNKGLEVAKQAYDNIGFSGRGLASLFVAFHMLIFTAIVVGIGSAYILMAKILLAFTVAFGPFFIFALLFDATKQLFTPWVGSIINYALTTVLVAAVFSLLVTYYSNTIDDVITNDDVDYLTVVITGTLIGIVAILATLNIPGLAASWSAGVTASMQAYAASRGINAAKGAASAGGGAAKSAAGSSWQSAQSSAASATGVAGKAAQAVLRYARQ